ncbi:WD40-repeat-containing domain protein [Schizophyllum amplum]|uniref:WD40-repeat-containing domain protein n=1 Tax=Schizophyllum amplum TaxID=97359 RepID=A0A550CQQ7_9AGAR|nr:WD40-repeat-containing domain protein [Auriculariopsis ampla]
MATAPVSMVSHPVVFTTQTPYPLPSQKFMLPASWRRYQLSQLINKALSLSKPVPFDFLVRGEVLRTTIGEWCAEHGVGEEETLELEYIESVLPPQKMSDMPHEDWVSSVSCALPGYFLTASYDGHVRAFDYSQNLKAQHALHGAPVTSICVVPSSADAQDESSHLVASSSHDLTAQISRISVSSGSTTPLATLHLHTQPLSSVASNASGSHLLTSSWDGLIGLWDTTIPSSDEVPDVATDRERNKRRKVGGDGEGSQAKRKAPLTVLKSHTARVSRVVYAPKNPNRAYSCGFDSTVRTWDVENGVCTHTINAAEKPFLDMALSSDSHTALAASTDRTVAVYDTRDAGAVAATVSTLPHTATPSCIAPGAEAQQVMTGAYDGVARLWDLRSPKAAMSSFKVWDGQKKILSIDWKKGVAAIGGEGGLEVWKVG